MFAKFGCQKDAKALSPLTREKVQRCIDKAIESSPYQDEKQLQNDGYRLITADEYFDEVEKQKEADYSKPIPMWVKTAGVDFSDYKQNMQLHDSNRQKECSYKYDGEADMKPYHDSIIETLKHFQCLSGGFGGGPMQLPHGYV